MFDPYLKKLWRYLVHSLPAHIRGLGKPISAAAADNEYSTGSWDHFFGDGETPRYEAIVELILAHGRKGSVLDIGCGSGRLSDMLRSEKQLHIHGIDFSEEGLARARALGVTNSSFEHGDFETWTPKESYDVILFNETIGYASDPALTVQRFAKALKPGGILIISYYRSGNFRQIWKRIEKVIPEKSSKTVSFAEDKVWDIKVF